MQIFLSAGDADPAIYEVEVDLAKRVPRCNCRINELRSSCVHMRLVKARMNRNAGLYPLKLPADVRSEVPVLLKDKAKFREFIIRHGRIEVL